MKLQCNGSHYLQEYTESKDLQVSCHLLLQYWFVSRMNTCLLRKKGSCCGCSVPKKKNSVLTFVCTDHCSTLASLGEEGRMIEGCNESKNCVINTLFAMWMRRLMPAGNNWCLVCLSVWVWKNFTLIYPRIILVQALALHLWLCSNLVMTVLE